MYISNEVKKKIVDFLKKEFKPRFIYLFGSFSKGEGRKDSDIQIVHLKDISTVFSAQIVGTKEVLYCEDEELMAA